MESFEKISEGDYKYDFLQDKNISEDVGFVAHCDRPDWGKEKRDTLFLEEDKEKRYSYQYMSIIEASNFYYGKIEYMTHQHRERKVVMNKKKAGFGSIPNGSFSAYQEDYAARVKTEIIEMLQAEEPLTISAVRHRANVTSKTAKKWLLVLVDEEKVRMRQVEGTRLFFLNHKGGGDDKK